MSEVPSPGGGPEPTTSQPQAGTSQSHATPQAGDGKPVSQFKSVEEAEAAFQRLLKDKQEANAEAAETRRKLKQLEDAQKTDEQKRAERLQELEGKATSFETEQQNWRIERAILLQAPEVGLKPSLAMKLIDRAAVKLDKTTGEPTNIAEVLAQVFVDFPELKPQEPTTPTPQPGPRVNPGATNPGRSAVNAQPVTNPRSLTWNDVLKRPQ